VRELGNSRINC